MNKILLFVLACILLVGCAQQQPAPITQIYAFGDGSSDNGNFMRTVREQVANGEQEQWILTTIESVTKDDRLSNGPVAVEVLAEKLQADLKDYAVFGALSDDKFFSMSGPGLFGQIDQFKNDLQGKKIDPNSLFYIFVSGSDFYNSFCYNDTPVVTTDLADQAVANISTAVTRLADLGAKRFLVVNSKNLPIEPQIDFCSKGDQAPVFQDRINSKLPGEMEKLAKQLQVNVELFDYSALSNRIVSNPDQYGLTNVSESCINYLDFDGLEVGGICESPDKYYFWDRHHTTQHVSQIIGEAMADQISP
jgi:cholinesterase